MLIGSTIDDIPKERAHNLFWFFPKNSKEDYLGGVPKSFLIVEFEKILLFGNFGEDSLQRLEIFPS